MDVESVMSPAISKSFQESLLKGRSCYFYLFLLQPFGRVASQ